MNLSSRALVGGTCLILVLVVTALLFIQSQTRTTPQPTVTPLAIFTAQPATRVVPATPTAIPATPTPVVVVSAPVVRPTSIPSPSPTEWVVTAIPSPTPISIPSPRAPTLTPTPSNWALAVIIPTPTGYVGPCEAWRQFVPASGTVDSKQTGISGYRILFVTWQEAASAPWNDEWVAVVVYGSDWVTFINAKTVGGFEYPADCPSQTVVPSRMAESGVTRRVELNDLVSFGLAKIVTSAPQTPR